MNHFVELTGIKGEPIFVIAKHILCVGHAFGHRKSTIDPNQTLTEVVGVMVSVPGTNFVVQESMVAVAALVNMVLDEENG